MSHLRPQPRHRPGYRHLRWLYALGTLLLLSGLGWLIAHYLLRGSGPFGDLPHPSEPWWLRLHGAAAFGFLIAFGALLPHHVGHNWRRRQHYRTGLTLVIAVSALTLSGYGLYYVVGDRLRAAVSVIHWVVGLLCTLVMVSHVVLSYRHSARERRRMRERHGVRPRELASS